MDTRQIIVNQALDLICSLGAREQAPKSWADYAQSLIDAREWEADAGLSNASERKKKEYWATLELDARIFYRGIKYAENKALRAHVRWPEPI